MSFIKNKFQSLLIILIWRLVEITINKINLKVILYIKKKIKFLVFLKNVMSKMLQVKQRKKLGITSYCSVSFYFPLHVNYKYCRILLEQLIVRF